MRLARALLVLALALAVPILAPREARAVGEGDGVIATLFWNWSASDAAEVSRLAAEAGAKHITFLVWMEQDSPRASSVRWWGEQDATPFARTTIATTLDAAIKDAHARGLTVGIDPIVTEPGHGPRHFFWPSDRTAWFASYGNRIRELGAFAEQEGCDELVAGSELDLLFQDTAAWRSVIAGLRGVFRGHVTISAMWPDFETIRFWDACDSIGVSAYFPLAASMSTRSTTVLEWAWRAHRYFLKLVARAWGKPITLVEVGYPTTEVAAVTPWDYNWGARHVDQELQARCFEAFRRVWSHDPAVRRFGIWGGQPVAMDQQQTGGKGFQPFGKLADPVVRRLFAERAQ